MPGSADARSTRSNRISISLTPELYAQLVELSQREGRSLSNLCVHLIAGAMARVDGPG